MIGVTSGLFGWIVTDACVMFVATFATLVLRITLRYTMIGKAVVTQALLLNDLQTRCGIFVHFTIKCSVVAFAEHTT